MVILRGATPVFPTPGPGYDRLNEAQFRQAVEQFMEETASRGSEVESIATYVQTFATADRTHANLTAVTLTDTTGGTRDDTVSAITAVGGSGATTAQEGEINNNFSELTQEINALRADLLDAKELLNAIIDDLQEFGLFN